MPVKFTRMTKNNSLVQELASGKYAWWDRIVELNSRDKDIHVQVRANSLNVYCKMGSLFQISLNDGKLVCKIHYKYLLNDREHEYIEILPDHSCVAHQQQLADYHVSGDLLQAKNIDILKRNISNYVGEEKSIQSKLVESNKNTILDAEVAFSEKIADKKNTTRIDLVNYDKRMGKVVFVELKQIFDGRLYTDEIITQLKSYRSFIKNNKQDIIEAYNNVIETKKALRLIDGGSPLYSAQIADVEERVLLVVAGYNQVVIDGLKDKFVNKVSQDALGIYTFGSTVDLNVMSGNNKILFPSGN